MIDLKGLSSEAVAVLRNCHLGVGAEFVRCGRKLGASVAPRIAREIREKLGDGTADVFAAYNSETGHEDYVRVNRGSAAFSLICHFKS